MIFNWKGDVQKDLILETLGIMAKAAKNVASDSKPVDISIASSRISTTETNKKFSHLHIIFRDWQYNKKDEASVFGTLFNLERTNEAQSRDRLALQKCIL